MANLVVAAFRPKPGKDADLLACTRDHLPILRTEGLVSGRCVNEGPRGYLSIRTNADPKDKRTDRIGGEVGALGFFIPGWGMHLADMSAPQGDLVREVEALNSPAKTAPRPAR